MRFFIVLFLDASCYFCSQKVPVVRLSACNHDITQIMTEPIRLVLLCAVSGCRNNVLLRFL